MKLIMKQIRTRMISGTIMGTVWGVYCILALFNSTASAQQEGAYFRTDYSVGSAPQSVATGDFNGDGKLDLAVANYGDNTVSILLGNNDGTFQSQVTYATGVSPISVAVGDFNGDGKPDLVVANQLASPYTVSILIGNGDGTFQPHVDYKTGNAPYAVAVGDFNGDGKLDLAVATGDSNGVAVLLGNGDGTFKPQVTYFTGNGPRGVAVGDFDGDGILDLAVTNYQPSSSTVSILLGKGDGTFKPQVSYATGDAPGAVVVADLNEDGILDLAVANYGSFTLVYSVSILLGNGDGTFQPQVTYATATIPGGVAVGDFNSDGFLDLAVANTNSNTIGIQLGNGDGTFQPQVTYATGVEPVSMAAGDFKAGGGLDLAVVNAGGGTVSVMLPTPLFASLPTSFNFGRQALGTVSIPHEIVVHNSGFATLKISSIAISGANAADFHQTKAGCTSVPPGEDECVITVTFTPKAAGTRTADLKITDNAPGSPHLIPLSGIGVGAVVTLVPTKLTFSSQTVGTTSPAKTVKLTNTGNEALVISGRSKSGDFAESDNCGSSVAPAASCSFSITFTPTTTGTRTGSVTITDNAGSGSQSISLTGTGK
jgi:hypothetical protein